MSFFTWQDGNQGNVGQPNIPTTLYDPAFEDQNKVEWACPPQYPPDDCNKNIKWQPKQIQSLLSNLYSAIGALARFKNKITGQKESIQSCNDGVADNLLGDYLSYFADQTLTRDQIPVELAKLACPVANDPLLAIKPLLPDDAIFIVRKGATGSDPCVLLVSTVGDLAVPLAPIIAPLLPPPLIDIHINGGSLVNGNIVLTDNAAGTPDVIIPLTNYIINVTNNVGIYTITQGSSSFTIDTNQPPEILGGVI